MNQDIIVFVLFFLGSIAFVMGMLYGIYIVLKPEKDLTKLDTSNPLIFKCSNFKFSCDFKKRIVQLDVAYTTRVFDISEFSYELDQNTKVKTTHIPGVYTGLVNGQFVSMTGPGQTYRDTVDAGDYSLTFSGFDPETKTPKQQQFLHLSTKAKHDFGLFWKHSFYPRCSKL